MTITADAGLTGFDPAFAGDACWLRSADGSQEALPIARWEGRRTDAGDAAFDAEVAAACDGPTIDLGCGPGRYVESLAVRGIPCLGVDESPRAVALTRDRGGCAVRRSIFAALPGEGRWHVALVLDGNIGIGGDPVHVLTRARSLIAPDGRVLVEFGGVGTGLVTGAARVETAVGSGPWFPWARAGVEQAALLAVTSGMRLVSARDFGGRCLAVLRR